MTGPRLNPLWLFLPLASLYAALAAIGRGDPEAVLPGLVFSVVSAFVLPNPLEGVRAFPILLLFLFLTGLGFTPSRAFSPSLLFTAEMLLVFRLLLAVLSAVTKKRLHPERALIGACVGLVVEFGFLCVLLIASFHPTRGPLERIAAKGHLWILLLSVLPLFPAKLLRRK